MLALLALSIVACGGTTTHTTRGAASAATPAVPLPADLAQLLPAGLEGLVVLEPHRLYASAATRPVVQALLPAARLDSLERRFGVRFPELTAVWIAQLPDDHFIVLAAGVQRAPDVARAIGLRMNTLEFSSDAPFVRRSGYLGMERRDVAALDDTTLLFAAAPGPQVAALLERAQGRPWPPGFSAATEDPELAALRAEAASDPVRVFVPRHLDLDVATGPGLLLSRQTGLLFSLGPAGGAELSLRVLVRGELPPNAHDNFRRWVQSVGRSGLGALTGIGEGLQTLRVEAEARRAVVTERLPTQGVVRAIRLLLADRVGQAMQQALEARPGAGPGLP